MYFRLEGENGPIWGPNPERGLEYTGRGKTRIGAGDWSEPDGYAVFLLEPKDGPTLRLELQYQDMVEMADLLHFRILDALSPDERMDKLMKVRSWVEREIVDLDSIMSDGGPRKGDGDE